MCKKIGVFVVYDQSIASKDNNQKRWSGGNSITAKKLQILPNWQTFEVKTVVVERPHHTRNESIQTEGKMWTDGNYKSRTL